MPANTTVGRISIKVSPETKQFRRELQRELEYVERKLKGNIEIKGQFDGAQASADFKRMMTQFRTEGSRGFDVKARVDLDRSALDRMSQVLPSLGGGASGAGAAGGGLLSSLGGGGDITMLLKVAAALAALGPALALVSGTLSTLPGLISGIAAPVGAVAAGIEGIKAAAASIAPEFEALKASVSAVFEGALTPAFEQLKTLIPTVATGLSQVAGSLSAVFGEVVGQLTSGPGLASIQTIFQNISFGIADMAPGIGILTTSFLKMAESMTGAGMSEAFNQMAQGVSHFVDKITTIPPDGGLSPLQQVFDNLLQVVTSLGEGGFDLIAQGLEQMAKPEFAENMKELVSGLFSLVQAAASVGNALTAIGGFADFAFGTFNALRSAVSAVATIWGNFGSIVSTALSVAQSAVSAGVSAIVGAITSGFSGLVSIVSSAWTAAVGAIQAGIATAVSVVAALPGQIVGALGNLGSLLVASGKSLIQGFIDGIKGMIGAAVDAARSVVSAVRNLFPFSPAKEGPFSGKGWVLYSGISVGEGFAEGISQSTQSAVDAAKGLVGAVSDELQNAEGFNLGEALGTAGKSSMDMGFDFIDSNLSQLQSDLGIGGGAITAALGEAWSYGKEAMGSVFNFQVNSVDEAISVKDREVSKAALPLIGR